MTMRTTIASSAFASHSTQESAVPATLIVTKGRGFSANSTGNAAYNHPAAEAQSANSDVCGQATEHAG